MLIRWCLLGSVILLAIASGSCVRGKKKKAADQSLNQGIQENFVIPAPKAKILGERELQALVSLSASGELVFAEGGTSGQQNLVEPNAFNVGDILVIGTHQAAPEGALRRVTAVNNSGQTLVVQTEQAALTDAIKDAYVKVSIPMDPTQAKETLPPQEGIVQQNPALLKLTDSKQGLYFGINDYVLFDVDGNKSTKNDQVVLNGNLGVDAGADIVFRIESFSIKEVSISVHGDQSASLSLVGTGSASFKEKIDISLLYYTPIVITIGSFPIVITPSLGIALGAEGEVNSKFRTSANEEAHVKIGVGYLDGEFKPITEGTVEGKAEPPAIAAANLSSRAYATIKGNLSLYGSSGGYAGMEAFARFNANLIDESCFKAHAGLGAQVGLFAGLFGLKVADYAKSWDITSKEIGVGSCNVKGATGSDPQAYSWLYTEPTTDDDVDFPFYDASSDGGLVSTRGRNRNGYALKLAANGASVFYRDSQATHAESFRNIKTLKDGGSLIAGSSVGAVLLRLNPQGAVQWASLYKNSGTYRIFAAAESPGDGSLLVGGMVYTSDDVNDDMFLLKVSANGEVLWSKRFKGPNNSDAIRSIVVLSDGKIVLGGSYGITSGMAGIDPIDQTKASMGWLAILDSAGTVQKSKLYSSKSIVDVIAMKDGAEGFTVLGETERTVGGMSVPVPWVMRLDASGTMVWRQGFLDYILPRSLAASSEGFLITGIRNYATGGDARKNHDGWLAHLSSSGTVLWAKTYGSTLEDGLLYVHQNSDGRILAGGYQVPVAMTLKPWFLSLASSGDASFTPGTDFTMSNTSAALFTAPLSYVDAPLTVSDLAVTRENWDRTLTLGSIKSEPIATP